MKPSTRSRALSGSTRIERSVISGPMSRRGKSAARARPACSPMRGSITGSPVAVHWRNGDRAGKAAVQRIHAGHDLRQPLGEPLRAGEFGVQGEAGRDPPAGLGRCVVVAGQHPGGVCGQDEQPLGPRADQRIGPPQHVEGAVLRRVPLRLVEPGAPRGRIGRAAARGEADGLPRGALQGTDHRQQIGRGAAHRVPAGAAEQLAGARAPVRDRACGVHHDHRERHPAGKPRRIRAVHRSLGSFPWLSPTPSQRAGALVRYKICGADTTVRPGRGAPGGNGRIRAHARARATMRAVLASKLCVRTLIRAGHGWGFDPRREFAGRDTRTIPRPPEEAT